MQQNVRTECPRCSRPLQNFDGRIGYCSQHKWVSPAGLGFEAEAAARNQEEAAAAEARRLDEERRRVEAERADRQKQQKRTTVKILMAVVALCLVAVIAVVFLVRPSSNYKSALAAFEAGEYETAQTTFAGLGSYKDSSARVLLCDAMIDLREGRSEAAVEKLFQLIDGNETDTVGKLSQALQPVLASWKTYGLTPQSVLALLQRADVIDPKGELDTEALWIESHTGLLEEEPLSAYAEDMDGDGEAELVALGRDHTVSVYRMTPAAWASPGS